MDASPRIQELPDAFNYSLHTEPDSDISILKAEIDSKNFNVDDFLSDELKEDFDLDAGFKNLPPIAYNLLIDTDINNQSKGNEEIDSNYDRFTEENDFDLDAPPKEFPGAFDYSLQTEPDINQKKHQIMNPIRFNDQPKEPNNEHDIVNETDVLNPDDYQNFINSGPPKPLSLPPQLITTLSGLQYWKHPCGEEIKTGTITTRHKLCDDLHGVKGLVCTNPARFKCFSCDFMSNHTALMNHVPQFSVQKISLRKDEKTKCFIVDFDVIPTPKSVNHLFFKQKFSKLKNGTFIEFEKGSKKVSEKKVGVKSEDFTEYVDENLPICFSCARQKKLKSGNGPMIKGYVHPQKKDLE